MLVYLAAMEQSIIPFLELYAYANDAKGICSCATIQISGGMTRRGFRRARAAEALSTRSGSAGVLARSGV
jgi:hypothetical protein